VPVAAGKLQEIHSRVCQTEIVPEFCTCGVQLPPDARFCHKCGKPQYDYPGFVEEPEPQPPPLPESAPLQMAPEIGFHNRLAVRIGFITALAGIFVFLVPLPLPFLRLVIAFIAAGFLAAFLYSHRTGQPLSIRGGARLGWITGIFSFAMFIALSTVDIVVLSNGGGLAKSIQSQLPPDDARSQMLAQILNDPSNLAAMVLLSLILMFIVLTALPIIGGALGAKVLTKE